jgi:hypothetical protein
MIQRLKELEGKGNSEEQLAAAIRLRDRATEAYEQGHQILRSIERGMKKGGAK